MKRIAIAMALSAMTIGAASAAQQLFDKKQVCDTYASYAVLAFNTAIGIPACNVHQEPRWHNNYKVHFDWCMGGGNWSAENAARDAVLIRCDPQWRVKLKLKSRASENRRSVAIGAHETKKAARRSSRAAQFLALATSREVSSSS